MPPSPSGVEDHYLPICQCTTAGLGNHFMGERRGDHHDQIYSLNGLDHVRCDQIQRLVRGYSLQGQVNASGGPDALQILWKQVAQADVRPHAGQITSNGGAAVARLQLPQHSFPCFSLQNSLYVLPAPPSSRRNRTCNISRLFNVALVWHFYSRTGDAERLKWRWKHRRKSIQLSSNQGSV